MASMALAFDILARDKASKEFDRVGKSAQSTGSKINDLSKKALTGLAKGAGVAAVGGVAALGAALVQGVRDAASYQKLADKTAAVLKSTGNVAHQSVKGIQERAGALESMSGVDEETIIQGQNVLATFTKVRDGVGKGNDIFNQATTAALNMSTALGTDMQGSVIQLGKALNDPIKGITALSRVGVSFTDGQKKQIAAMVKSGDTMGAQKVILAELNKEFGGAAKAAGQGFEGSMARAKDSVQDAFRAIGIKLLPVLTKMADYVATHAGPAIDRMSGFLSSTVASVKNAVQFMVRFQDVLVPVAAAVATLVAGFKIYALTQRTIIAVQKAWIAVQTALNVVMNANPIGLVIIAVAALAAGVVVAYKKSETFRKIVKGAFDAIGAAARFMWNDVVAPVIRFLIGAFVKVTEFYATLLRGLSKVPGFGWAKGAADKLQNVANKAAGIKDAIHDIPSKKDVTVNLKVNSAGQVSLGNGVKVDLGVARTRAGGGPVLPGQLYQVGDNPDGSWNRTTELFAPSQSGRIVNQKQLAEAVAGGGRGGGKVELSQMSVNMIAEAISRIQVKGHIDPRAFTAAPGIAY